MTVVGAIGQAAEGEDGWVRKPLLSHLSFAATLRYERLDKRRGAEIMFVVSAFYLCSLLGLEKWNECVCHSKPKQFFPRFSSKHAPHLFIASIKRTNHISQNQSHLKAIT